LKSAGIIDPILRKLSEEGLISYVSYVENGANIPHDQIPALLAESDLVIDQFLGVIGVFPIEALAAGRLVMSYMPNEESSTPIINVTPVTLESEIRRVAAERPVHEGGAEYARRWHDGRESVSAIRRAF
jgi:hypothetical protein